MSRQTIRKSKERNSAEDCPIAPTPCARRSLTPDQEAIVVELRTTPLLHTDDLLTATREFINPAVPRAGLDRCLRRHGVIHIDIKYLPQMPDETMRRYLFVAIYRATRWAFREVDSDQTEGSSVDFLSKVGNACPVKIIKLLTENAPRHPQMNGMVERFNGRISEIVQQTRLACAAKLESTLRSYPKIYNNSIPQRALKHLTPNQALKDWRQKKPELFLKRVYNQAGLD